MSSPTVPEEEEELQPQTDPQGTKWPYLAAGMLAALALLLAAMTIGVRRYMRRRATPEPTTAPGQQLGATTQHSARAAVALPGEEAELEDVEYEERKRSRIRTFYTATDKVSVSEVGDGSLYSALAQQAYGSAPGSPSHEEDISRLRSLVEEHLFRKKDDYLDLLLTSAGMHADRYAGLVTDEDLVEAYLGDLSKGEITPGPEIIQAAANALGVHVKFYSEGGDTIRVATEGQVATKTLHIGERMLMADGDEIQYLYYSVASVSRISANPQQSQENGEIDGSVPRAAEETFLTDSRPVTILRMRKDGDSLYSTVAHQMYRHPIQSSMHAKITTWLRNVVKFQLMLNRERYRDLILKSVSLHGERYEHLLSEYARIQKYLLDLDEPGFSPGDEVIQLMADFLGVNVLVFPEGGRVFLVSSRAPHVSMVVRIGRRLVKSTDGKMRHHYGSVIKPRAPDIRPQSVRKDMAVDAGELQFYLPYEEKAVNQDVEKTDDEQMELVDIYMMTPEEAILTSSEVVTVLRVPRDEDSLFAALAHQLYRNPIGSAQHTKDMLTLRTEVWLELVRNFQDYVGLLHRSLEHHGDRYLKFPSTEEKMDAYLRDLESPGFRGGVEVIRAMANLAAVDVIVFSEGGDGYLVKSNTRPALRTIAVVQRLVQTLDGIMQLHYESVVAVRPLEHVDSVVEDKEDIVTGS